MPEKEQYILFAYDQEKYEWAKEHRFDIWKYFISEELLFSNDPKLVNPFVREGGFTKAFGQESPGRLGHFLGFEVVRSFAEKHSELELKELMNTNDYKVFLKTFKPKQR